MKSDPLLKNISRTFRQSFGYECVEFIREELETPTPSRLISTKYSMHSLFDAAIMASSLNAQVISTLTSLSKLMASTRFPAFYLFSRYSATLFLSSATVPSCSKPTFLSISTTVSKLSSPSNTRAIPLPCKYVRLLAFFKPDLTTVTRTGLWKSAKHSLDSFLIGE